MRTLPASFCFPPLLIASPTAATSAYIKSFCMGSAVRLLQVSPSSALHRSRARPFADRFPQLFSVFSRRKILCASGGNHRYLLLILETINNIIQYQ